MRKSFPGAGAAGAWASAWLSAWMLLSTVAAFAASPDQLYQTWENNYIRDPDVAEKAAGDYLHAAPQGPHAQDLQLWLDAYHKAVANLMNQSRTAGKPANKQAQAQPPAPPPSPPKQPAAAPVKQAFMPPPPKQAVAAPVKQAAAPPKPPIFVQTQPNKPTVQPLKQVTAPATPVQRPEMQLASALPKENAAPPMQKEPAKPAPSPGAKPAGQSLDDTLAFIADKVESQDSLNFTAEFVNPAGGARVERLSYMASNVTIDPNRCQVSWRWHVQQDGHATPDEDRAVQLRLSKSIGVETIGQALGDINAGHFRVRVYPGAYAVHIARWDKSSGDNLYFRDKGMAESVADAARHALDLCDKRGK